MARIDNETIRHLFHIQVKQGEQPPSEGWPQPSLRRRQRDRALMPSQLADAAARASEPQHCRPWRAEIERPQQRPAKRVTVSTGPAQA